MKIVSTQYSASTKSLDIYISGCKAPHCDECHNSELFDFSIGDTVDFNYITGILKKIKEFDKLIDNIFLYGGEPLDQNINELVILLRHLYTKNKPIWLFTKYDIEEVPESVKLYCSYIKCGRYLKEYKMEFYTMYGIKLATHNQKIYERGIDY